MTSVHSGIDMTYATGICLEAYMDPFSTTDPVCAKTAVRSVWVAVMAPGELWFFPPKMDRVDDLLDMVNLPG